MHFNEVETDEFLVRRLLAAQFPEWEDLPIQHVPSLGTDNAIYRLGEAMAVRLPRIDWAVGQVEKEQEWLPELAPLLPLKPVPDLATTVHFIEALIPGEVTHPLPAEIAAVEEACSISQAAKDRRQRGGARPCG